jgi:hypothetical protein
VGGVLSPPYQGGVPAQRAGWFEGARALIRGARG